jgi:hypothetical protein
VSFLNRTRSRLAGLGAVALLALAAACSEKIEAGAACPVLCPLENDVVRDTLIEGVAVDSTVLGFPFPGEQPFLLVALRPGPDSVDVRTVIRFDSLPARFFPSGGADSLPITRADSSFLILHVDTLTRRTIGTTTLEAYDVDTTEGVDTSAAALSALFRPARRIGTVTFDSTYLKGDTLRLPLANDVIVAKAGGSRRLRIGLRLTGATPSRFRIYSSQGGISTRGAALSFDPGPDTTYAPLVLSPVSGTPAANTELANGLRDFTFLARGTGAGQGADLVVGGVPARRTFIRFAIPSRLADSTTIVRAVLRLVQRPSPGADPADTVALVPDVVVASEAVTDLQRIVALTSSGQLFGVDSVRIVPTDSGLREVSLVGVVRSWRALPTGTQRAVVLRSALEGAQASDLRFYSMEASAALRPRLQISYIPRSNFGIP